MYKRRRDRNNSLSSCCGAGRLTCNCPQYIPLQIHFERSYAIGIFTNHDLSGTSCLLPVVTMRFSTVFTFAALSVLYSAAVAIPLQSESPEIAARSPFELDSRGYSLEALDVFNKLIARYEHFEARYDSDEPVDGDSLHLHRRSPSAGSGGQPSSMPNGQPQNPANAPSTKPRLPPLRIPSMSSGSGPSSSSASLSPFDYYLPNSPYSSVGDAKPDSPYPYTAHTTPGSAAPAFSPANDPRSPRAALNGNLNGRNPFYNPSGPVQNMHVLTEGMTQAPTAAQRTMN
ncbi:hypothetical protein K474DRAFT_1675303 [Panus rudis PR-1116 ss-1]|nr:hypothetical protein K474DRAFT_1675303 [Panus rudis PR-1116 ss-1]